MRIYELDDQSGKFGCRTTKFNFQTELFKQMSDNGNPFKIYYDRLQLRETRFIVPHADVQGTDAKKKPDNGEEEDVEYVIYWDDDSANLYYNSVRASACMCVFSNSS